MLTILASSRNREAHELNENYLKATETNRSRLHKRLRTDIPVSLNLILILFPSTDLFSNGDNWEHRRKIYTYFSVTFHSSKYFGICKVHSVPRVELGTKLSPSFIPPNPSPLEYLSSLPYGSVFPSSSGLSKVDHPPSQIKVYLIRFLISRHQQNNNYCMYVTKYFRNLYTVNIYRI